MNEDTEVYLELTDDDNSVAEAAAEDTARLLLEVRDQRTAKNKTDGSTGTSEAMKSELE